MSVCVCLFLCIYLHVHNLVITDLRPISQMEQSLLYLPAVISLARSFCKENNPIKQSPITASSLAATVLVCVLRGAVDGNVLNRSRDGGWPYMWVLSHATVLYRIQCHYWNTL